MKISFLCLLMLSSSLLFGNNPKSLVIIKENTPTINLNLSNFDNRKVSGFHYGHGMMIGGGAFMITSLLTNQTYFGLDNTRSQPLINQKGRFAALITGAVIFLGGVGITIII